MYGWGLWWWEDFAAVSALRRKIITAFVVVCGFLASGFLIGELANSKIGLTDENDLPQYVGTRGQISFADIPRLLVEKTDLGQFGQSQRFRPFYYVARLTETALWGLNGSYWYRWRIVMFGMVIAAMFWLCTQCVGVVLGAIITAYTLSLPMWVDIWTRSTGPSEQYTSLGTAIFALGAWFFLAILYTFSNHNYFTAPFLTLFVIGYWYTGLMSLLQGRFERWRSGAASTDDESSPKPFPVGV